MSNIPKKLKISVAENSESLTELGTMEWDGDKWFISGTYKDGIKDIIGKRGMYYGKKIYTLKDRDLYKPLMIGYTGFIVEVVE